MRKPPETLDTACYTAARNRKGHRSPDQHDRFQAWTVSSCSPHCGHPPRMASSSSDRPQPVQRRTRHVAHAFERAVSAFVPTSRRQECRRPYASNKLPGKKTVRSQPLFTLLLRAAIEVRSTGARGASQKTKATARLLASPWSPRRGTPHRENRTNSAEY